jgi:hypothetical protein
MAVLILVRAKYFNGNPKRFTESRSTKLPNFLSAQPVNIVDHAIAPLHFL